MIRFSFCLRVFLMICNGFNLHPEIKVNDKANYLRRTNSSALHIK